MDSQKVPPTLCDPILIDALHERTLTTPGWPLQTGYQATDALLAHVLDNHRFNSLLWMEEDQARRTDVPDAAIAANKRAIDRYNQCRNDAVEAMDDVILEAVSRHCPAPSEDAWVNSETAGSLIDRLSIGSLKVHHMARQCRRPDAAPDHRQRCVAKLASLRAQRDHLRHCLRLLLDGMRTGRCTYRAHRQFEMYNDPSLNPYLYGTGALQEA